MEERVGPGDPLGNCSTDQNWYPYYQDLSRTPIAPMCPERLPLVALQPVRLQEMLQGWLDPMRSQPVPVKAPVRSYFGEPQRLALGRASLWRLRATSTTQDLKRSGGTSSKLIWPATPSWSHSSSDLEKS